MVKKCIAISLFVSLLSVGTVFGQERFEIDPAHAFVTFSIAHFAGKARGSFKDVSGMIVYNEKDLTKSSVEVTIKTASIYTGNDRRDAHLRSADFFEVEKYPDMTFKSKRIERRNNALIAVGDLTVKGVTKEVTMPFLLKGPFKDPLPAGLQRLLVATSFKVDRRDFEIKWSRVMEDGGLFVGNEVTLEIDVEAIVPKPRSG